MHTIQAPANIILSRNDGVGDMVLMLPMAFLIKKHFPQTTIAVLGKQYTKAIVDACENVDVFIDAEDFFNRKVLVGDQAPQCIIHVRTNREAANRAKVLNIPLRIGTNSRLYHLLTCNRLVTLNRKNSHLHEAQLNLKLLQPFGINEIFSTVQLGKMYGLSKIATPNEKFMRLIDNEKLNLIVHPKSHGSSLEWPLENFARLINMLSENKFNIFISAVENERPYTQQLLSLLSRKVHDLTGSMPLDQFMGFMKSTDGILANATGPAHLGAALGINTICLFPSVKPIHPARWAPLGAKVKVFEARGANMSSIESADVAAFIELLFVKKHSAKTK